MNVEEYPVLDLPESEELISVAAAKQKLDWEGTPAYKRKMLQLAYQAYNRRANVSPTARSRNRAKNKQARASRKRNRR